MGVPPHLIQAFVFFCESNNMEEAARAIGITQPALSKQLRTFESLLPYKLFSFSGKKKILTPFGVSLFEALEGKFRSLDNAVASACNNYGEPKNSVLRIAARAEIIDRLASSLVFDGLIEYYELAHDKIISEMLSGRIDIGITHTVPDSSDIVGKKLFREKFHLLIPNQLNRKNVDLEQIPSIAYKKHDPVLFAFCQSLNIDFTKLNVKRICSNYMLVRDMVQSGFGWGVVPSYLKFDAAKCVSLVPGKRGSEQKEFFIFYRKEQAQVAWFKRVRADIAQIF